MSSATHIDHQTTLEIYKLSVEMADRVSGRRNYANSFFLTLHAMLAAFVGILSSAREANESGPLPPIDSVAVFSTAIAGIALACSWWVLLRSYRDLNSAKFEVINKLEESLPSRPFTDEWDVLKSPHRTRWRLPYAEIGFVERFVPAVFVAVYIALAIRAGT